MSEVTWGVPTQKRTRVEKFDTPVVTMAAIEKGKGRKFSFNKAAQDLLGLVGGESHISFGFLDNKSIVIMASDNETSNSFSLTKQFSISNGRTAKHIAKISNLDTSIENYLHLANVEDQPYVEVTHISNDNAPEQKQDEEVTLMEAESQEEVAEENTTQDAGSNGAVFSAAGEGADDEETEEWD